MMIQREKRNKVLQNPSANFKRYLISETPQLNSRGVSIFVPTLRQNRRRSEPRLKKPFIHTIADVAFWRRGNIWHCWSNYKYSLGQITIEYFILFTIIALASVIGLSTIFPSIQATIQSMQQHAIHDIQHADGN